MRRAYDTWYTFSSGFRQQMRKEIWSTGSSLSTRPRNVFFSRRANCDLCIAIKSSAHICCSNHYDMISCDITHHIMSYEVSSSCHIISYHIILYHIISYSSPEIQKAPSSLSKIQARSFYSSIISYHIIQQSRNTKGIIIVKSSGTQLLQQYHIISYHIIAYHIISYHITSYSSPEIQKASSLPKIQAHSFYSITT